MFSTWSCILFFYVNIATVIYKKENITRRSSFHSIYSNCNFNFVELNRIIFKFTENYIFIQN